MYRATKRLTAGLTVTAIIVLMACDSGEFSGPQVGPGDPAFSLSPSEMTLAVGESATIVATLAKANGAAVNPNALKWESTDESRATVDRDGVLTGVAPGYPMIIASSGRLADTTYVRIVEKPAPRAGVNISPDTVVLRWIEATATLTAEVLGDDGTLVAQPGLTWKSLNPGIAQADNMGRITAKGAGVALIVASATCCSNADTAYARVQQVVDSVAFEQETISLAPGGSAQLKPKALDRGGSTIQDASFSFKSANESVARVSSDGVVTSQSSGTTTVTAASGDHSDKVTVTVAEGATAGPGPRPDQYPNEPTGFVPWFEHDWQSWPNEANQKMVASGAGMILSSHYERDAREDFVLVDDPNAPHGKGKSLRHRQREGQRNGTTSGIFNLFNPVGGTSTSRDDQVRLRSVYRSHWVYFEPDPVTGDWQFGNTHMRTFWGNRHYGVTHQAVSLRSPANALDQRYSSYGGAIMWHGTPTTYYRSDRLEVPVGRWHHHEYLWEPEGVYGVTDGMTSRLRAWIDGVLVIDRVITQTIAAPFANEHFAMVWLGGSENVRAQDDFVRFGDIYISGVPY